MKGKALVLASVALLLGGCTAGGTGGGPTPSRSKAAASPSSASSKLSDAQWKSFWESQGATVTPPRDVADIRKYSRALPTVQNLSGGKVSDADAQRWVSGTYATSAIEEWAAEHFQTNLLSHGLLSRPEAYQTVFYGDLSVIRKAVAAGAVSTVADPYGTYTGVGVVAVPAATKVSIQADPHYDKNAPLTDTAIILRTQGPIVIKSVMPDGSKPTLIAQGAVLYTILVSGEFVEDPTIGPLWVATSVYSCADVSAIREVCGQLK